ncbi:MAG: dephospho-CoA kinase [Acidocella sp. 20-57-95]|nr:MAG: dephospho-CoA kinase [Acidocella sp. 20-57-95]OYV60785.1 MAG: dephospho-CoA kinase [Acidocella sp. 21-58-7]HQT64914.1 dephospho-CoA kinase [Acidocella sp.]HQU03830.1 dephospho-CoA kinase [Acidocella sp.]
MLVLGLTGGIGMGKSTVAKMFASLGVPTFNADDAVHALQAPGGKAMPLLTLAFPEAVEDGVLNRAVLRDIVLTDPDGMHDLESIMHPLVHKEEALFRARAFRSGAKAVLLDIPLLFETGAQLRVNKTIVVSAPRNVQIARVLARGILDEHQINAIIAKQMPDAQKRALADYVIPTGLSKFHTVRAVHRLAKELGL